METKECPKCCKQAILRTTGRVFMTMPPIHEREWWCACGYRDRGPDERWPTEEELTMQRWHKAQEAVNGSN